MIRLEGDDIVLVHRRIDEVTRWRGETVVAGVVPMRVHVRRVDIAGQAAEHFGIGVVPRPVRELLLAAARPMVFDATLGDAQREALRDGLLAPEAARMAALAGAWLLVARDGLDDAGVVVHAALDLFDLDQTPLPDTAVIAAFEALASRPPSPVRESLASRLALALPDA